MCSFHLESVISLPPDLLPCKAVNAACMLRVLKPCLQDSSSALTGDPGRWPAEITLLESRGCTWESLGQPPDVS